MTIKMHLNLKFLVRPTDPDPEKAWVPKGFSEGIWSFPRKLGIERIEFTDLRYAGWSRDPETLPRLLALQRS
jgi:hypothetical protein